MAVKFANVAVFPTRGRAAWKELQCARCHEIEGRGDGPAAATLKDDAGLPAPAYDLTGNAPRGGATLEAVMRAE